MYDIREVDGRIHSDVLHFLNAQAPDRFPPLQEKHFDRGYWWFAYNEIQTIIGFAGMVPMTPFEAWYLKRAYIAPAHRGNRLQISFLRAREVKATQVGISHLVSECAGDNEASARNFLKAGYRPIDPEQPWGCPGSLYFEKRL